MADIFDRVAHNPNLPPPAGFEDAEDITPKLPQGFEDATDVTAQVRGAQAASAPLTKAEASGEIDRALNLKNPMAVARPRLVNPIDLVRGRRAAPRSTAEGLVTEQTEQKQGAPLVIPFEGAHAQPVAQPTVSLSAPSQLPQPDYDKSGFGGGKPTESKATPVPYEGGTVWVANDESPEAQAEAQRNNETEERGRLEAGITLSGARGYPKIYSGVKKLIHSHALEGASEGGFIPTDYTPEVDTREATAGASQLLRGAGEASTPLIVAGAAGAPLATGVGLATAAGAQAGTEKLLENTNLSPETKQFASDVAGLIGGFAGGVGAHAIGAKATGALENNLADLLWKRGYVEDVNGQPITVQGQQEAQAIAREIIRQNPQGPIESLIAASRAAKAAAEVPARQAMGRAAV